MMKILRSFSSFIPHPSSLLSVLLASCLLLLASFTGCFDYFDWSDQKDWAAIERAERAKNVHLDWAPIPAGSFEMGCVPQDTACENNESPSHTVNISGFEMTATEITQQQYSDVMKGNPSYFSGCGECPVENVDWFGASEFCSAFGGRLPTEAEWEYAARAGTETIYICGDSDSCLDDVAWWDELETHPVGQKEPNGFGLYDMSGNVWEWCSDWYGDTYYNSSPSENPTGPSSGSHRVLRGGSWSYDSGVDADLRASDRLNNTPDYEGDGDGFRCVRD